MNTQELIDRAAATLCHAMADPFPERAEIRAAILDIIGAASRSPEPEKPESVSGVDGTPFPVPSYHIHGKDYVETRHYKELFRSHEELRQWKESSLTVSDVATRMLNERNAFASQVDDLNQKNAYLTQRVGLLSEKLRNVQKAL